MAASRTLPLTALLVSLSLVGTAAASDGDADEGGIDRSAWRYVDKGDAVTIYALGAKRWTAQRSDGKRPNYGEVDRTEEYVELQNQDTKLFVRLHADRGYWRRPKDAEWTGWFKGEWVESPMTASPETTKPVARPSGPLERSIRLAYLVPKDRKPVSQFEKKIRVLAAVVAELYAEDLSRKGYKSAGIRWESQDGEPVIHRIAGAREAAYYNNAPMYDANEQWRRLVPEIKAKLGDPRRQLLVVFAETYDEGPSDVLWPGVMARGAYYSADGGLAIYSSHLLRDEFCATTIEEQRKRFFDRTPVTGRKAWGHRTDSPRCEFVEDGFGAVAHELGHALGLPHDRREDDWEIMGNGFRNLRRNFDPMARRPVAFSDENSWLLMSSRYVSPDLNPNDTEPPQVDIELQGRGADSQTVRVKAADNSGLRAVVFFDQAGGTIITGQKLAGKSNEVVKKLPLHSAKGKLVMVQAIVTDDGGHQTRLALAQD